jgi:hypothetical protein
MFDEQGFIIGDIIVIEYDEGDYDYVKMANEIYAAICSNSEHSNRCFSIYLANEDEDLCDCLDTYEFYR